jgi:Phosphotransferase enzyme family
VLLVRNGMLFAFPQVEVPRFQRIAPHLAAAVGRTWGQEIICLFPVPSSVDSAPQLGARYYVAQALRCRDAWAGSSWIPVAALDSNAFEDKREYETLIACIARLNGSSNTSGPFEQFGWFSRLTAWIDQSIATYGLRLTGAFRQLNASPAFSLIRFETNGSAVWFKAVGEPNLHELPVSRCLARFYPDFVPKILAVREEWNAWLTAEVQGTHLDSNSNLCEWTAVTRTLANLQISSVNDTLHLIEAGCKDVRPRNLVQEVEPFLEVVAELMDQQTKPSPAPLSRAELAALGAQVRDALSAYADLEIVNTLGHLDFNPGNTIVLRDGCVLLDWAGACIGPPFLTFQFLLERLHQLRPTEESWTHRLLSDYSDTWRSFLTPGEITEAIAAAPLLAVFTYATANGAWRDSNLLRNSNGAYFRSLARRIDREAARWSSRRKSTEVFAT